MIYRAMVVILMCFNIAFAEESYKEFVPFDLRNGQIVLTESGDANSLFMALVPQVFYPFSHVGIIAVENGETFVYEARGDFKIGTGTPAKDWFKDNSGIRRLRIDEYIKREGYAAVYDPPSDTDIKSLMDFVHTQYKNETRFDPHFDLSSQERLYCAEFVYAAFLRGGWSRVTPILNKDNPSLMNVLDWWGVNDSRSIPVGSLVQNLELVGELGTKEERLRAMTFNAFKKEVHKRFTKDQKMGNIFKFSKGLGYQPPISTFLNQSQELIGGASGSQKSAAEIENHVMALAVLLFGRPTFLSD